MRNMYNPDGELTKHKELVLHFKSMLEDTNDMEEIDKLEKSLSESQAIVNELISKFSKVSERIEKLLPHLISHSKKLNELNLSIDRLKKNDQETLKMKKNLVIQKNEASQKESSYTKQITDLIPSDHDWYDLESGFSIKRLSQYYVGVNKNGQRVI